MVSSRLQPTRYPKIVLSHDLLFKIDQEPAIPGQRIYMETRIDVLRELALRGLCQVVILKPTKDYFCGCLGEETAQSILNQLLSWGFIEENSIEGSTEDIRRTEVTIAAENGWAIVGLEDAFEKYPLVDCLPLVELERMLSDDDDSDDDGDDDFPGGGNNSSGGGSGNNSSGGGSGSSSSGKGGGSGFPGAGNVGSSGSGFRASGSSGGVTTGRMFVIPYLPTGNFIGAAFANSWLNAAQSSGFAAGVSNQITGMQGFNRGLLAAIDPSAQLRLVAFTNGIPQPTEQPEAGAIDPSNSNPPLFALTLRGLSTEGTVPVSEIPQRLRERSAAQVMNADLATLTFWQPPEQNSLIPTEVTNPLAGGNFLVATYPTMPAAVLPVNPSSNSAGNRGGSNNVVNPVVEPTPPPPLQRPDPGSGYNLDGTQTIAIMVNTQLILDRFGGVGRGIQPQPDVIREVDTLQFQGIGLTAANLILTQVGNDLVITFANGGNTRVTLQNFTLENLDNLTPETSASTRIGNILFDGDSQIQDNFDVINADALIEQVLRRNTVTFLNDLDNQVIGYDASNDVINGQGGNDILRGLGGNDILRGGTGNDVLCGGTGINILTGNQGSDTFVLSFNGFSQVTDFTPGQDLIGLPDNVRSNQLMIEQGTGVNSSSTWIKYQDIVLMSLSGVQANTLTTDMFMPPSRYLPVPADTSSGYRC